MQHRTIAVGPRTVAAIIPPAALIVFLLLIPPVQTAAQQSRRPSNRQPAAKFLLLADQATAAGDRLRAEWKRESLQLAAKKYAEARFFCQITNHPRREADILKRLGDVHATLSEYQIAIDYYNRALKLMAESPDVRFEVDVLGQLSNAYFEMANVDKALPYCRRAQQLSQQVGYQKGTAAALNCLGVASSISNDVLKAQENLDHALAMWGQTKGDEVAADTLLSLGYLHSNLGNMQLALAFYKKSLAIWRVLHDERKQALTATAMGGVYALQGEKQTALNLHNQALDLFRTMGNRNGEAITLNGIGYFYDDLGERSQALRCYEQALELYRAIENRHYAAITLGYIGRVYFGLGEQDKALEFYKQKLITSRAVQDRRMESYTLRDIGNVISSTKDREKARDYYQQALALSGEVLDRRGRAYILNSIGAFYEQFNRKPESLDYYHQALSLMQAVADRRGEVSILYSIARVERDLGHLDEARTQIERSLELIESLRTKVVSPSLRISYLETVYQHYEFYIDLLMRLHRQDPSRGYLGLAFEANEHARARTLLENLIATNTDIRQGVDPELLAAERRLQQRLNQKAEQQTRLLSGKFLPEQAASIKREVEILLAEYREVESNVRDKSPKYAALTQPQPLKLADLQQELDQDTLLLEYSLGSERSYLWVLTADSLTSFELPSRHEIETAAKDLYDPLAASTAGSQTESPARKKARLARIAEAYPAAAAKLSSILLDPAKRMLGQKRLVIVADGLLQYIPFIALPEPNQEHLAVEQRTPLVFAHEVITLPSLSALAVLRREVGGRPEAPKALAVFADPVFEKDDPRVTAERRRPLTRSRLRSGDQQDRTANEFAAYTNPITFQRLPFSAQEAEGILAIVPARESKRALGFEASLKTALDAELRQYRIVHFATHGLLSSDPELSGIVLSLVNRRGKPQNGFLRLNEIYNLDLPANLVVLSACQTALGKDARGEGLIGLTRGFMYAGVARVVASLWRIDDRAAAELMRYFYEAMFRQGLPPAAALRAAQIRMWQTAEWRLPHYWAAFVLQGTWN